MMEKDNYIGLVPARKGSKGILRKNLRKVLGKPLIEHTFNAIENSILLTKSYVSSDDEEILKLAKNFNLFSFKRPGNIATDVTSMSKVIDHFINNLLVEECFERTHIVLLQPTSPLRDGEDIDKAINLYNTSSKNCLISVRESKDVIQKSFYIEQECFLTPVFNEKEAHKRRQDLKKTCYPNGAIYIFSVKSFIENKRIPFNCSIPFFMNKFKSIDIDTLDDIHYLEYIWSLKNE